jgi:hypothetical protein
LYLGLQGLQGLSVVAVTLPGYLYLYTYMRGMRDEPSTLYIQS